MSSLGEPGVAISWQIIAAKNDCCASSSLGFRDVYFINQIIMSINCVDS